MSDNIEIEIEALYGPPGEDGNGIVGIEKTGTVGNVDIYTITYTNGDTDEFTVTNAYDYDGGEGIIVSAGYISIDDSVVATKTNLLSKEDNTNKVTSLSASSTDTEYPSAKCVYDGLSIKADASSLATVATSGSYSDLSNKPTIPDAQIQSDWSQSDNTAKDYIKNKPTIPAAQVQSNWNEADTTSPAYIQNKPTIPAAQVQSDWSQADSSAVDYIKNKPIIPTVPTTLSSFTDDLGTSPTHTHSQYLTSHQDISGKENTSNKVTSISSSSTDTQYPSAKCVYDALGYKANTSSLSTVATSGSYNDLSNKPTIPDAQVQADWNVTNSSSKAYIKNKPYIPSANDFESVNNKVISISDQSDDLQYPSAKCVYDAISNISVDVNVQGGNSITVTPAAGGGFDFEHPEEINPSREFTSWYSIIYNNGLYIAIGDNATISTSTDAKNWSPQVIGNNYELLSKIVCGKDSIHNDMYVVVGERGLISNSLDGQMWNTSSVSQDNFVDVAYGNGMFVAVGENGLVATSYDGYNWNTQQLTYNSSPISISCVAYGDGKFIGAGGNGKGFIFDGTNWYTQEIVNNDSFVSIAYGDYNNTHTFVAIGDYGTIATFDGSNWSTQQIQGVELKKVRYLNNQFIIVGVDTSDYNNWTGFIASSTDGSIWNQQTVNSSVLRDIVYTNGLYAALSLNSSIVSSDDLLNWNIDTFYNQEPLYCIVLGNNNILVGAGGGKSYLFEGGSGYIISCDVDEYLDNYSNNPVRNSTVANALGEKQENITGAATSITSNNLTTNRALVSNASGKVAVSSVTSTELGYVSGVTSAIQTQLGNKEDTSNKVTSLSSGSTDAQYPSAKCVYDLIGDIETLLQGV